MKILAIANRKGGASKSTLAAHLSVAAEKDGKKTILIDMDPQKTLESWWEKRTEESPSLVDIPPLELEDKLNLLRKSDFDICIIDTPGDTSTNAEVAIKYSDTVLIPCKPTPPDLSAVGKTISQVRDKFDKSFFFILSQSPPNSNIHIQATSVLSEFGPVCHEIMATRKVYSDVMGTGETAMEFNPLAKKEISLIWEYTKEKLGMTHKTKKTKVTI